MAIFDIFSKRKKKQNGDVPDVYKYDKLPKKLKIQIIYIWYDTLGNPEQYQKYSGNCYDLYKIIVETLCREYGVFELFKSENYGSRDYFKELIQFFGNEKNIEKQLDVIELSFKYIDNVTRDSSYLYKRNANEIANLAISELNQRFKEHGIGYQYSDGKIIRVDSDYTHSEIVKPALKLLNKKKFAGAQEEFLKAHEHYRKGNPKEALNECLKSFESTMKAICNKRGWKYNKNKSTARALINICFKNELIPNFWQSKFSSLRSLLESSVPTGRNKLSGHGQGSEPQIVPKHIVSYMINMTASSVVFLIKADEDLY
mgnify:CR=1 FL=1